MCTANLEIILQSCQDAVASRQLVFVFITILSEEIIYGIWPMYECCFVSCPEKWAYFHIGIDVHIGIDIHTGKMFI